MLGRSAQRTFPTKNSTESNFTTARQKRYGNGKKRFGECSEVLVFLGKRGRKTVSIVYKPWWGPSTKSGAQTCFSFSRRWRKFLNCQNCCEARNLTLWTRNLTKCQVWSWNLTFCRASSLTAVLQWSLNSLWKVLKHKMQNFVTRVSER